MTEQELEKTENWDLENAERRPGSSQARAVVSVAFPRGDFERVAAAAERAKMRLSEYIRRAALEKADYEEDFAWATTLSFSSGVVLYVHPSPRTWVAAKVSPRAEDAVTT